jgi:hypothetical protein
MTDDDHDPDRELEDDVARNVAPLDAKLLGDHLTPERSALADAILARLPLHATVVDALDAADEDVRGTVLGVRRMCALTGGAALPALDRALLLAATEPGRLACLADGWSRSTDELLVHTIALLLDD